MTGATDDSRCLAPIAIVRAEPERESFLDALVHAEYRAVPAPTLAEAMIVEGAQRGKEAAVELMKFVHAASLHIAVFDDRDVEADFDAFMKFGKGRHKAGLNFGDCLVYAAAKRHDDVLLCKGSDFVNTDIRVWQQTR